MIEEECMLPHGTDGQFIQKMHTRHARHPNYVKPKLDPTSFGVRHFAGEVVSKINRTRNAPLLKSDL